MIHFRKVLSNIDVQPLLDEIASHPEVWNTDKSWTQNKPETVLEQVDDIVLRYNKPGDPQWNKPAFNYLPAARKIIFDIMRAIPGEHLGKVIISRLRPGQIIAPHIDHLHPGLRGQAYYQRYQIPLSVKPGVLFHCGDEHLFMQPGDAWWFDNQVMHSVTNESDADRLSMLTDIRPFIPCDDALPAALS